MIGPWGHPWGVTKGVKRPKMGVTVTSHENGQKIMKKNEKLSIFAFELLNIGTLEITDFSIIASAV